ncbi:MAG: hypothetical protein RL685_3212 [Pseudomonadota bacterium]
MIVARLPSGRSSSPTVSFARQSRRGRYRFVPACNRCPGRGPGGPAEPERLCVAATSLIASVGPDTLTNAQHPLPPAPKRRQLQHLQRNPQRTHALHGHCPKCSWTVHGRRWSVSTTSRVATGGASDKEKRPAGESPAGQPRHAASSPAPTTAARLLRNCSLHSDYCTLLIALRLLRSAHCRVGAVHCTQRFRSAVVPSARTRLVSAVPPPTRNFVT